MLRLSADTDYYHTITTRHCVFELVLSSGSSREMDKNQVFDSYLYKYARGAYCAFQLRGQAPFVLDNGYGLVEQEFVQLIEEQLTDRQRRQLFGARLIIYLSYSSVSRCVDDLIKLQTNHQMELEIVSANPYRLHRVTCQGCNNYSTRPNYRLPNRWRNSNWYIRNTHGIQKLMSTPGITVRGFSWQDWNQLQKLINRCQKTYGKMTFIFPICARRSSSKIPWLAHKVENLRYATCSGQKFITVTRKFQS